MRFWSRENRNREKMMIFLALVMLAVSACGKKEFVPREHLQDVMVSVNSTELTLHDLGFLIQNTEVTVQKQAYLYDQNDPGSYWRLHVNGRFVSEMVKDGIIDTAVHDALFCEMAEKDGITLTAEEEKTIKEKAEGYYSGLSTFQKEGLDLDEANIQRAMERIGLAEKYRDYFCIEHSCEPADASVDGAVYKTFLGTFDVRVSAKWDEVPIGHVTLWENAIPEG